MWIVFNTLCVFTFQFYSYYDEDAHADDDDDDDYVDCKFIMRYKYCISLMSGIQ